MNELLELLMQNMVFVILVIAGIISMIRKASPGRQDGRSSLPGRQSPKPTGGMPSFGGQTPQGEETSTPVELEFPRADGEAAAWEAQKPTDEYNELYLDLTVQEGLSSLEEGTSSEWIPEQEQSHPTVKPSIPAASVKHRKKHPLNITDKELIRGVLMAEILGPPRSRKPFPYGNYQQPRGK